MLTDGGDPIGLHSWAHLHHGLTQQNNNVCIIKRFIFFSISIIIKESPPQKIRKALKVMTNFHLTKNLCAWLCTFFSHNIVIMCIYVCFTKGRDSILFMSLHVTHRSTGTEKGLEKRILK